MVVATPPMERGSQAPIKTPQLDERVGQRVQTPPAAAPVAQERTGRLGSLDAYRGFIMLAMASSAMGFGEVAKNKEVIEQFSGTSYDGAWRFLWETLAYQFEHVAWTGCSFWDLIQPSFMFMVGVSMPFSNARRQKDGQPTWSRWLHVVWRAMFLAVLGVFLSSNGAKLTNFTFVNVLTQIGLGYAFLYLFSEKSGRRESLGGWLKFQGAAAAVILLGYWAWFAWYQIPDGELTRLQSALVSANKPESEWTQFTGFKAHWNKHTNAAADADREFLSLLPRATEPQDGRTFWFNDGGYQTLNFIPSLATMLFGLMAGTVLRSDSTDRYKVRWLLLAGLACFAIVLPIDTTIWPSWISSWGAEWSLCPSVKRIWTPTWALFSSGWTFWILAAFYWVIDLKGFSRWSWPLVVVGVNSITMYLMSQLMRPFTRSALKTHLTTLDTWFAWDPGIVFYLFGEQAPYAPILGRVAVLFVFWLVCVWLYLQKIFVRI